MWRSIVASLLWDAPPVRDQPNEAGVSGRVGMMKSELERQPSRVSETGADASQQGSRVLIGAHLLVSGILQQRASWQDQTIPPIVIGKKARGGMRPGGPMIHPSGRNLQRQQTRGRNLQSKADSH